MQDHKPTLTDQKQSWSLLISDKPLFHLLLFSVAIVSLFSCGGSESKAPAPTTRDTLLSPPISTIVVPVHYTMQELDELVNSKMHGTFIKKWMLLDQRGDSLYVELSRRKDIHITRSGKTLYYALPISIKGLYVAKLAGVKIKNSQPIEAQLTLYLATHLGLDPKWNFDTHTDLLRIEWERDPQLKLGFVNVNLKKPIEKILTEKESNITNKADEALSKLINARKIVSKLWLDLQKPILINKPNTKVWLKAYGTGLKGVLLDNDPNLISLQLELKAYVRTILEGETIPESNKELPDFKRKTLENDSLLIFIHTIVPFDQLSKILTQQLSKVPLEASGFSTSIRKVRVYGTDNGIVVELKTKGDVDGTFYAEGVPVFDPETKAISVKDLHFTVSSENVLLNSADWFLHSTVMDALKSKLVFNTSTLVNKLPSLISKGIEKGKSGGKMNVTVEQLDVSPYIILTTKSDLQLILKASGKADIQLEKKVFEKKKKGV